MLVVPDIWGQSFTSSSQDQVELCSTLGFHGNKELMVTSVPGYPACLALKQSGESLQGCVCVFSVKAFPEFSRPSSVVPGRLVLTVSFSGSEWLFSFPSPDWRR